MNPLILLHGALGSSTQLEPLAEKMTAIGRRIFLLNFSGHGGVAFSKNEFGIEAFSQDLLNFLNENLIDQADVFGYSMGGYVALWLSHQQPSRIGKIVTLGTKFDWDLESAAREVRKMNPAKIEEKVPAFAQTLRDRHYPMDWKEMLHKTATMMTRLGQQPLLTEGVLKKVKSPVRILLGDQDEMADLIFSKQVAAWLPFGRFDLLPNTPHPIEKVKADLIIDAMLK